MQQEHHTLSQIKQMTKEEWQEQEFNDFVKVYNKSIKDEETNKRKRAFYEVIENICNIIIFIVCIPIIPVLAIIDKCKE